MANSQKKCPLGHSYDSNLVACPICGYSDNQGFSPTVPVRGAWNNNVQGNAGLNPTNAITNPNFGGGQGFAGNGVTSPAASVSNEKTTFVETVQGTRVRPVVGWLVCAEGADVGKDFRLHCDHNYIGRALGQDVCLTDTAVSREEHFSIAYDRFSNRYFASMGKGQSIVYINGYPLGNSMTTLRKGDQIKVGNTTLVFIPLEQQDLKWKWQQ